MTPERWQQIEKLYHSAREHGAGVLAETDPEIRREVERLLAQDSEGKLLDRNALEVLEQFTDTDLQPVKAQRFAGQIISHYRIEEKIGAGGMGVVYKAVDTKLGRRVALKFLPPHLSDDEELKRRLSDEARAASALDHPNIVVIHDIDETPDGDLFIAMAYHEGVTLRQRIKDGLSLTESLRIARQIASGLAKAHEHGIVHRDIKPGNVIVAKDGIARIIDFGLAKSGEVTATAEGSARGTPLYMSPEQATGGTLDARTDLWSLGAVLFQMIAGTPPFRGETQLQLLHAVVHEEPPRLREAQPGVPKAVDAIVHRALQKDVTKRYASAVEMVTDLSASLSELESPMAKLVGLRPAYAIAAAVAVLLAAGVLFWLFQRSEKRHWARERAIPEIGRLKEKNQPVAAFKLMREAQKHLPGDAELGQIAEGITHAVSVQSMPGASVEIQDYLTPGEPWFPLGTAPLKNVRIPSGYLRWRVAKPGVGEYVSAPVHKDIQGFVREFNFPLDTVAASPEGMVPVPAGPAFSIVFSLGDLGPFDLPAFHMDRFEVSNRQYQEFVDHGGYQKRQYWKEKFLRDGKELSWEQAMELLRDSTGRPGPSIWQAGRYPAGQADYPVGGVSWYEAAAFAEYVGKSLPVIAQWYLAAPSSVAKFITPLSNYSGAPAPVGTHPGVGPLGTYDMAGNIAEWCRNAGGGDTRYLLGGGWNTSTYEYFEPGVWPAFQRIANRGFRCVRNSGPLPAAAVAEHRPLIRDFSKAKPVSDDIFRIYKAMYTYDRSPLNAKLEPVEQDSKDWRKEKVTIDAAYGNERIPAYLFLPINVKPPYQTVVFFPSALALGIPSSKTLGDMKFVDYVIQSGRAVLYPVYKGTYERPAPNHALHTAAGRETVIHDSKDLGRAIDYLETRADIDRNRIGFLGVSMGGALGVIWAAVEDRLKVVVILDGGFFTEKPLPGVDQADFAPRVKAPTLMISGKFDWIFMGKDALLRLLGAPAADKKAVMLETSHDVSEQRPELTRTVLAWLDKYLGKVSPR